MTPPTPTPSPNPDIQNVWGKLIIFCEGGRGGGRGYPSTEDYVKIIYLIFEPFPNERTFSKFLKGLPKHSSDIHFTFRLHSCYIQITFMLHSGNIR